MPELVRPDQTVEVLVAELVDEHPFGTQPPRSTDVTRAARDEGRVLHAARIPAAVVGIHHGERRIRIRAEPPAHVGQRVEDGLAVAIELIFVLGLQQEVDGHLGKVERLARHAEDLGDAPLLLLVLIGQPRLVERHLVQLEVLAAHPGEVVNVLRLVAVGDGAVLAAHAVAEADPRSAELALEALGHGQADHVRAVVGVELAAAVELMAVPAPGRLAADRVLFPDAGLRIPLRDHEESAVSALAGAREDPRHAALPGEIERGFTACGDGCPQRDAHDGLVVGVAVVLVHELKLARLDELGPVLTLERREVDAAGLARVERVATVRAQRLAHERRALVLERVEVEMQAHLLHLDGRGVLPAELALGVDAVRLGVKARVDGVGELALRCARVLGPGRRFRKQPGDQVRREGKERPEEKQATTTHAL